MAKQSALPGIRRWRDAERDTVPPKPRAVPRAISPERRVGRCMLFGEIARGGMATVHLGRWLGSGGFSKTVAVKALHRQYAADPKFVTMLLDEARVVARIAHPNVVPTIDLLDEKGELFIVMDYVEGVTLASLLTGLRRRGQRMAPGVALRIVSDALHGLHAAHVATDRNGELMGIIHRDVSPENIIVGADGYARIIDFGIARALGRSTVTRQGIIKGKPSYVAPEQILGNPLAAYTDVYSASVVLWQALAGRKLFAGDCQVEKIFNIMRQPVAPPSTFAEGLSSSLDRVVLRGLSRKPQRRWPSAQAMAEQLEQLGGLASHRKVGELVAAVHADELARRAELVRAVEHAPVPDVATSELVPQRLSLSSAIRVDVAAHESNEEVSDEPSRISLTSKAGPREDASSPNVSVFGVVAAAAAVALLIAAIMSAVGLRQAPAHSTPPSATVEVEPRSVGSTPAHPAASAVPPKAESVKAPPRATAEPSAAAPARKRKLRGRAKRWRYLPTDI